MGYRVRQNEHHAHKDKPERDRAENKGEYRREITCKKKNGSGDRK